MNAYLASLGPALANHLWQSTVLGLLAWLLTLALRRNHARIRYAIWLAASIKFLVPFSLLVAAGNLLPYPRQTVAPVVYSTMDAVEEPFVLPGLAPASPQVYVPTLRERITAGLPAAIAVLWSLGAGIVLFGWGNRWRAVSRSARRTAPATSGRELSTLRRLEAGARPVPLLLSDERMEPGIFGAFRPILIWPRQLSVHLDDSHIEAILAHELMHVRRRDNLTALLHMFVEAAFWFHPLVWWMERQMVKEREQACDEAVVALGGSAETYAESLLKACWFCVESPLPCVSGVTGADLKRRVADIVTGRALPRLTWPKKLLLAATAACVIAAPLAFGVVRMIPLYGQILHADGPLPSFEVATIRPMEMHLLPPPGAAAPRVAPIGEPIVSQQEIRIVNVPGFSNLVDRVTTAKMLMADAYHMPAFSKAQIAGGPDWADQTLFQVHAKIDDAQYATMQKMTSAQQSDQVRLMEQSLLAARFQLKVHFETREMPVYALEIAKGGPKLTPAKADSVPAVSAVVSPQGSLGTMAVTGKGEEFELKGKGVSPGQLILLFQQQPELDNRMVIDKTGLASKFDMTLDWTREGAATADTGSAPNEAAPSFFTALREQLGLELIETKGPVEVLVIDHIEKPTVDGAEVGAPAETDPKTGGSANTPARLTFDVASIQPAKDNSPRPGMNVGFLPGGKFSATNLPLSILIPLAYGLPYQSTLLSFAPGVRPPQDPYDIEAVGPRSEFPSGISDQASDAKMRRMLQSLLADRFHLKIHIQTQILPAYVLVVGKNGPKLNPSKTSPEQCAADTTCHEIGGGQGNGLHGNAVTIGDVVHFVQNWTDRPLIDETGLKGLYNIQTDGWTPMRSRAAGPDGGTPSGPDAGLNDPDRQTIFQVFTQLGLRMEPARRPVVIYIVESIEKPTAN